MVPTVTLSEFKIINLPDNKWPQNLIKHLKQKIFKICFSD